uniref:Uncharacterized protein n=1 Tax=Timema tahoe TaxID=61484 RepID=A0A7R9IJJ8_9NEOP|nr:unnamed protein product [Timema tahoe]
MDRRKQLKDPAANYKKDLYLGYGQTGATERARLKDRTGFIFQARALHPVQSSLQALGNIIFTEPRFEPMPPRQQLESYLLITRSLASLATQSLGRSLARLSVQPNPSMSLPLPPYLGYSSYLHIRPEIDKEKGPQVWLRGLTGSSPSGISTRAGNPVRSFDTIETLVKVSVTLRTESVVRCPLAACRQCCGHNFGEQVSGGGEDHKQLEVTSCVKSWKLVCCKGEFDMFKYIVALFVVQVVTCYVMRELVTEDKVLQTVLVALSHDMFADHPDQCYDSVNQLYYGLQTSWNRPGLCEQLRCIPYTEPGQLTITHHGRTKSDYETGPNKVLSEVKEGFGIQINLCRDRGLNSGPPAHKSDTLPLDHQLELDELWCVRPLIETGVADAEMVAVRCGVVIVEPPCELRPGNLSLLYPDCCFSIYCPAEAPTPKRL